MEKKRLSFTKMKEQAMEKAYPVLCSTGVIFSGMMGNVCYAEVTTDEIMTKVQNIVYNIFQSIGFILILWGVGQLIMAFKNEDSDSKARAVMSIVAGAALFAFPSIAKSLKLTAPKLNTSNT